MQSPDSIVWSRGGWSGKRVDCGDLSICEEYVSEGGVCGTGTLIRLTVDFALMSTVRLRLLNVDTFLPGTWMERPAKLNPTFFGSLRRGLGGSDELLSLSSLAKSESDSVDDKSRCSVW